MSHLVYDQIRQGRIDASQLIVVFIDEEALYPSMEAMTMRWRKRFLSVGAQFRWYCLPLKQISVLRQLQNSESWITWEGRAKRTAGCAPPALLGRYVPARTWNMSGR